LATGERGQLTHFIGMAWKPARPADVCILSYEK